MQVLFVFLLCASILTAVSDRMGYNRLKVHLNISFEHLDNKLDKIERANKNCARRVFFYFKHTRYCLPHFDKIEIKIDLNFENITKTDKKHFNRVSSTLLSLT